MTTFFKNPNYIKIQADQIQLTQEQKEILAGSALGDLSLKKQKNDKNVRFQMHHSIIQRHYVSFKYKKLLSLCTQKSVHLTKPSGYSKHPKIFVQSRRLPCLTKLHNELYVNNRLTIQSKWLYKYISPRALAVWWMDDGSIMSNRKGRLATHCFSAQEVDTLRDFLEKRYQIKTNRSLVKTSGKSYWVIDFQPNAMKEFLRLIMPYIPHRTMVYKSFLRYKDKNLQQRWIIEMKQAMPQFRFLFNKLNKKQINFKIILMNWFHFNK